MTLPTPEEIQSATSQAKNSLENPDLFPEQRVIEFGPYMDVMTRAILEFARSGATVAAANTMANLGKNLIYQAGIVMQSVMAAETRGMEEPRT